MPHTEWISRGPASDDPRASWRRVSVAPPASGQVAPVGRGLPGRPTRRPVCGTLDRLQIAEVAASRRAGCPHIADAESISARSGPIRRPRAHRDTRPAPRPAAIRKTGPPSPGRKRPKADRTAPAPAHPRRPGRRGRAVRTDQGGRPGRTWAGGPDQPGRATGTDEDRGRDRPGRVAGAGTTTGAVPGWGAAPVVRGAEGQLRSTSLATSSR